MNGWTIWGIRGYTRRTYRHDDVELGLGDRGCNDCNDCVYSDLWQEAVLIDVGCENE